MTTSFRISADGRTGPRRWVQVRVHADEEELREAAHRLRPERGRSGWDRCNGCFHPSGWWGDEGQLEFPSNGFAGTLRLCETQLTAEIVAHELVHAAVAILRMNRTQDVRLGPECHAREEDLAYIYGELFAAIQDHLIR